MSKILPNSTLSHKELEKQGYIIDTTCYQNVYYKGPRFEPDECGCVLTSLEYDLLAVCQVAVLALTHEPINPKDIEFIKQEIAKVEEK